ncbi:UbiA family prenyltransferase [Nannocystis bainbridge]|uniref:UbiA family prenyltransferase n=1 Tax=Nannocystis bainbridge TaxID=2995303 RepID=A0ABT5EBS8_9BACT|nr:UbiA family prenyltransferase [Nannocystis bainbridge]MDC0723312.1 UbiA family prenyltransferase [Nannocystis bainbridge]
MTTSERLRDGRAGHARPPAWAGVRLGLRALRARQWAHFVPLPLAGAPLQDMFSGTCSMGPVLWACVAGALCLASAYGLNAYGDRGSDGRGKNPLVGAQVGGAAVVPALACGLLALVVAGQSGGLGPAAVSLTTGALYSLGPRLKRLPGLGTLANVAIFAPLLGLVGTPRSPGFWGMSLVFTALLLQNQLVHERADEAEDRRARVFTTAQWLGPAGVAAAGRWLALAGSAAAALLLGPWAALCGAAGLVFGAWLIGQVDPAAARRRHRALALATGAVIYALAPGGAA